MRFKLRMFLGMWFLLGAVWGCTERESPRTFSRNLVVSVALLPQAYTGGGFSLPSTQAESFVPCRQAGAETLRMTVEAPSLSQPLLYDLTSLLHSDCQGALVVPEEENLYFRLEGFDGSGELIREGFAEFSVTSGTNEILFLLWKARRLPFSTSLKDLAAVDLVFSSDGTRLVLHFSVPITPPSRGEGELSQWLLAFASGGELCCALAFSDPREDGFPLQSFSGTPTRRLPFRFIGRDLHLFFDRSLFPGGVLPEKAGFFRAGTDPRSLTTDPSLWFSFE
jgi:hypothetical protein